MTPYEEKIYISALVQIGAQILAYRKRHNLSQAALAKKLGVSRKTISRIERGENISLRTLAKVVAKLEGNLKVDVGILRRRENEKSFES